MGVTKAHQSPRTYEGLRVSPADSEGASAAHTLTSGVQPPEEGASERLSFTPSPVWGFVCAAPAH